MKIVLPLMFLAGFLSYTIGLNHLANSTAGGWKGLDEYAPSIWAVLIGFTLMCGVTAVWAEKYKRSRVLGTLHLDATTR